MGRRRNGGGGGGERSLQLTLRRQVELCKSRYSTAEEIVHHLRSNYPGYQRTKYQTLIRLVHEALVSTTPTPSRNNDNEDEDEDEDEVRRTASRKKRKNADEAEARLQNIEALHINNRRMIMQDLSTSSDTASASESGGSDDGATSTSVTSDDAVYGEKLEPAFDLMKTMLRNSYTGTKAALAAEEKNVELETGNTDKATITVNVDGGEAKSATARKQLKGSATSNRGGGSGGGDVMVKGKGGPRFKDLGGMKELLEELMMEVIVPLCNPQLPRHLGVRPITGILLHGPPGCGKTRLAHAIANETGLPFHYISATEVVSGVSGIASTFLLYLWIICFHFINLRIRFG